MTGTKDGMPDISIDELLTQRYAHRLSWCEPYPGRAADYNPVTANVTLSATVQDCIAIQRQANSNGVLKLSLSDRDLLLDFMAINWATVVPPS